MERGEQTMIREREVSAVSGWILLGLLLPLLALGIYGFVTGILSQSVVQIVGSAVFSLLMIFLMLGLFVVNPNEARVLQLFGKYTGTVKNAGLGWANPLLTKRRISVRIRNFDSDKLKVNDLGGNPIEIAAVVVWKVVDTAEAMFQVDNYEDFVHVQTEAALRNLATRYNYDSHEQGEESLRGSTASIADHLRVEVQERLEKAGVKVIEARISHLAYAPEIAQAMLQRQQATAIIAARQKIVEGAVGMVEMALESLARNNILELDEEKKASMVSNLLVVLCSDRATQPVVNTGTIYQ
jgi:regulator of protease activity HflC (stomatin/prohibitin superfamily)